MQQADWSGLRTRSTCPPQPTAGAVTLLARVTDAAAESPLCRPERDAQSAFAAKRGPPAGGMGRHNPRHQLELRDDSDTPRQTVTSQVHVSQNV